MDSLTREKAFTEINKIKNKNCFKGYLKKVGVFRIYINNMTYVDKNANRRDNEKQDIFFVDLHFSKNTRVLGRNK
jgi:hypothetical protein